MTNLAGTLIAVLDALDWRVRRVLGDDRVDRAIIESARRWRSIMNKAVFIGITGSAGKTTTRGLLLEVLSRNKRATGSRPNFNRPTELAATILRLRPKHEFCVAELSEGRPGEMDQAVALLQPSVGIVTVVGNDHWSAYGSREAIASEMNKLVASLPPAGTAVLNADDDLVVAMPATCAARVITYGTSPNAELRAEAISSIWPDRLQLTLIRGEERTLLRTQLCGSHWVPSVLAAVGGGLAVGMSLSECAAGIAAAAPFEGRMQPVATADGVTFIRDDFKAPLWTVDASFDFMRTARARRKIIVVGTLSDHGPGTGPSKRYAEVAQRAQEIADVTVFIGPWASSVLKTRKPGREDSLRAFSHVRDAAAYVNSITREGDLVLLKGTNKQDHLVRLIMDRSNAIACWRDDCDLTSFCTECPERMKPSGKALSMKSSVIAGNSQAPRAGQRIVDADGQVIVGLGNPESRYAGTPHNVGYEAVDRLAASMGLTWDATPDAWIAHGPLRQHDVRLVKIRTGMNHIGAGLKALSEQMSFSPEQCILVHDDLDIPTGSIRSRLSGGAGGHRGVASILEAFQSDAFRRIKIGVGQPDAKFDRVEYVLRPFDPVSRAAIERALATVEARVLEMLERRSSVESR